MEYAKAWQIAGEVVDMLSFEGATITAYQQEKIASIIGKRGPMHWNEHGQCWREEQPVTLRAVVIND
jgi:hypothetical protein